MAKRATKRKVKDEALPGYDGSVLIQSPVRLTATRVEPRSLRCRPGSFEWRYARDDRKLTALYHAGSYYARLWERAGTADARSVEWGKVGYSDWKGLPDGRLVALDELKRAMLSIGKLSTARLTAYCVDGKTSPELARQYGIPDRDMAAVLNEDLRACAVHFRFL